MINFLGDLPRRCTVAFSGGVDSVAIADFLLNNNKREMKLAFFHHGTQTSEEALDFVQDFAEKRKVELVVGRLSRDRSKDESPEEFWRNERLRFFSAFETVVTAHHLDDAVETWIFTSLHGESRLIPYTSGNVLHPFLVTPKSELKSWCIRRGLSWCEDKSNEDLRFMRNVIRHRIVPEALKVNPGLSTVIRKKYLDMEIGGS